MQWTDGRKYEGAFCSSKKHGDGQLLWPDGRSYTGQWEAGKQHGIGITVTGKGLSRKSEWQHGKLLRWLNEGPGQAEPDIGGTPIKTQHGYGSPKASAAEDEHRAGHLQG